MDGRVVPKRKLTIKNWCFWTVVLEKTLESPLDFKEIQPVNPKGNQSWIFWILELKLQYFAHLMQRNDSLENTLMLGKIEGGRRMGWQRMRWHHQLNGDEFEQVLGVGDGQGGLACCGPWGRKESDMTEQLNWTDAKNLHISLEFLLKAEYYNVIYTK